MIRLSGVRCLAISMVGALMGWWSSVNDGTTMTHYRGLSHEALLQELAQHNDGRLAPALTGGLVVVLTVVVLVDALTGAFEIASRRINPDDSTPGPAA